MRNLFHVSTVAVMLVCALQRAFALEATEPGRSLWGIPLGGSRERAVAAAQKRFFDPRGGRQPTRRYRNGIVEDEWDFVLPHSGTQTAFEILSRHGRVVQLRRWSSEGRGLTHLTFAQLIRRHHLRKRVYGFDDPGGGGGYDCFYYDDVRRGLCFSLGVQDDFLLTYRPDAVIVHKPGVPAFAIEDGVRGKTVSGPNARAFADEAEARRAEQHDRNAH